MSQTYEITLIIGKEQNGKYPLIMRSPVGEAREDLELPFTIQQFEEIMPKLGIILNKKPERLHDEHYKTVDITQWGQRQLGMALFDAVFHGPVMDRFQKTLGKLDEKDILRIYLQLDPRDPSVQKLTRLPWELMRERENNVPFCIRRRRTLIRSMEISKSPPVFEPLPKLKVLSVISQPSDLPRFDVDKARNDIQEALAHHQIEVAFLEKPTLLNLRKELLDHDYHVFHFTGHGGPHKGDWGLAFEDEAGKAQLVPAEDLAHVLVDRGHIRLAAIVSCSGGNYETPEEGKAFNHFNGVANSLALSGIPAVIAMQYAIGVEPAFTFAKSLYQRLALREPLDIAVNEARMAMKLEFMGSAQWAVPALYSKQKDMDIFPTKNQIIHINTVHQTLQPKEGCIKVVDLASWFNGGERKTRQASYPEAWLEKIKPELLKLQTMEDLDPDYPVHFTGQAWLSIWFGLGNVFGPSTRFQASMTQFNYATGLDETWSTRVDPKSTNPEMELERGPEKEGDLLVTLSFTHDIEADASHYMKKTETNWATWLKFRPRAEADRKVVEDNAMAAGLVESVVKRIREIRNETHPDKIHLFLAAPAGLAFLLGHHLTVGGNIQLYEYQDPGYTPSLTF